MQLWNSPFSSLNLIRVAKFNVEKNKAPFPT